MQLVLPAQQPPVLAVAGSDKGFPVHRVFCIGKNYADHVREMGSDPAKQPPVFFMKSADCVVPGGGRIPYPPATDNLHYEGEMVVALKSGGRDIDAADATSHIFGYAAGIDFTRRDLQAAARDKGLPWDMAKNFDAAAPVGPLQPAALQGHPSKARLTLSVNDQIRQDGDIDQMIYSVPDAVAALSKLITLKAGDIIFTGTPSGVGAVGAGDALTVTIAGVGTVTSTLY